MCQAPPCLLVDRRCVAVMHFSLNRRTISADVVLCELLLDRSQVCLEPPYRYEPPEYIPVSHNFRQLVKVALLLKLDQVVVLELAGQLQLNIEVTFALLQVVDEAAVLLDQVQLVAQQARHEAEN